MDQVVIIWRPMMTQVKKKKEKEFIAMIHQLSNRTSPKTLLIYRLITNLQVLEVKKEMKK